MKISCQTCGQILPKTAVMCPNCGGRTFLPINNTQATSNTWQSSTPTMMSSQTSAQPAQSYTPPQPHSTYQQPAPQQTTYQQPSHTPPAEPAYQQPTYVPPVYVPPVAPPIQQPVYVPETIQPASPILPPTYHDTRKLASNMRYTGFFRRGFAYAFDLTLVGLLLALAYQLAVPEIVKQLKINGINDQTLIISAVTFYLWYMSIFTSSGRQGTIGKIIMGLWVFGMQGQRINFFHALFRELLKLVLLPFFFVMWFTARKQTMADLLARTVVLYDPY